MTPLREIAGMLHPARNPAERYFVIFRFFCDESYDSPKAKRTPGSPPLEPQSYVVAGFFANQRTWEKVEGRWANKNKRVKVPRFHASHLNAGTYEFDGWSKSRRVRYSRDLLQILKTRGRSCMGLVAAIAVRL